MDKIEGAVAKGWDKIKKFASGDETNQENKPQVQQSQQSTENPK